MKRNLWIVAAVLAFGLTIYLSAVAASPPDQEPGYRQGRAAAPPLLRFVRQNMAAQTIAGLTGVPVDEIRKELQEQRLPAVLSQHQIDRKAFADGMRTRFDNLLGQLNNAGYLTAEQKDQVVADAQQRFQRRALMKSLIDKGVSDGTITPEQGDSLLKRP